MNDEARKNLIDVLQAAEEIQDFVRGMDFKAYQNKPVTNHLPILLGEVKEILSV